MTVDNQERVRNFAIIAHIDHGKSTLADRLLEETGTIEKRKMRGQVLDEMDLEREKGITIKLTAVRMRYQPLANSKLQISNNKLEERNAKWQMENGNWILNLIDTPGHVDFSYEVSRSLAACEGALLLVDAAQGIQAQTVSNVYKAQDLGLKIIPVVNKIDIDYADPEGTAREMCEHFGFSEEEVFFTSGKEGKGVEEVLDAVVERIPAPTGDPGAPLRALVFDSFYDEHKGVIAIARIVDGYVREVQVEELAGPGRVQNLRLIGSNAQFQPVELGYFTPEMEKTGCLQTGEVGYVATGLKDINMVRVGDTITQLTANRAPHTAGEEKSLKSEKRKAVRRARDAETAAQGKTSEVSADLTSEVGELGGIVKPLPGYKEPKPVVYANIFPVEKDRFLELRDALGKLKLNDAALEYQPTSSLALGRGFEIGVLGLLHLDIVRERLEREYGLNLVVTAPTVQYALVPSGEGKELSFGESLKLSSEEFAADSLKKIRNASELPDNYDRLLEPWAKVEIITPYEYIGNVMRLIDEKRGEFKDQEHLGEHRTKIIAEIPLSEIVSNFYDALKSASSGFASLDWKLLDWREMDGGKLEILVNKEVVEPFSRVVIADRAYDVGLRILKKLKESLPREQFAVPLQAAFRNRIIAREDIPAMRKDVTAKLYGGDQTRKDKLLKQQKKGKEKLAQIGSVSVPKDAFREILEI